MPEEITRDWREILHACSLTVLEGKPPVSAPMPVTAIHYVTGVEVEPSSSIEMEGPAALDEVDRRWQTETSDRLTNTEVGEFFILPPGGGGATIGWVRVRGATNIPLPSRIAAVTGSPEFLSLSADGNYLCAVTEEDDEYWIVVRQLAD
ncbi:hypothetical protein [Streptomyces sp. ALB3]|uniref:hypothetical protein n=1 Tax=Streptomyces sp. ALB3 TaxID=3374278 RepID=UPI0037A6DB35